MSIAERFGPKTWGRWSAWLALSVTLLLLLAVGFGTAMALKRCGADPSFCQSPRMIGGPLIGIGAALLLGFGAYRTLAKKSGGLRLLCGAWGVGLGIGASLLPPAIAALTEGRASAHTPMAILAFALSGLGLAATVLHKEK